MLSGYEIDDIYSRKRSAFRLPVYGMEKMQGVGCGKFDALAGNPSEPQTGQNAKQCVGKDVAYWPAKQAEPEIRQNEV